MVTVWPEMLKWSCIGEGAFRMFLKPLSKISCWLPNVLFITLHPVAFESVYDPFFFKDWIFILGGHKEVLDGGFSFQVHFYAIFLASPLETFTQPLVVWYCYVWFLIHVVIRIRVPVVAIFPLWGWYLAHHLHSVEGPCWLLAFLQTVIQMLFLFLQFRVGQSRWFLPYETESLSHYILMVWYDGCPNADTGFMCWLSVDSGLESALFIWSNQHI